MTGARASRLLGNERLRRGALLRDRYEIARTLGEGGMGVVYEAFDRVRGSRVALKTIRVVDGTGLFRFKNEFRALVDVSHPNLVSLHELDSEGDGAFFTMEYVEGVDFLRFVARVPRGVSPTESTLSADPVPPPLRSSAPRLLTAAAVPDVRGTMACDPERVRVALVQLVAGVSALHACGKLHRDLKPSNVLVTADGRVVVLDFGLVASLVRDGLETVDQGVVGTPEYMSPEQGAVAGLSEASDWYSVGVMLYEALAGVLPFSGPPLKIIIDKQRADPPRPSEIVDGVPEELDALCVELLQRDPKRRPLAHDILERLGASSAPRVVAQPAPSTMPSVTTTFVGRDAHMQALAEAYAASTHGTPVVTYVHGGSGMGKSLLVKRFLEMLGQGGPWSCPGAATSASRCRTRRSTASSTR